MNTTTAKTHRDFTTTETATTINNGSYREIVGAWKRARAAAEAANFALVCAKRDLDAYEAMSARVESLRVTLADRLGEPEDAEFAIESMSLSEFLGDASAKGTVFMVLDPGSLDSLGTGESVEHALRDAIITVEGWER